jgi:hypothetical protein
MAEPMSTNVCQLLYSNLQSSATCRGEVSAETSPRQVFRLEFLSGFLYPHFPFYKMLCMNRLRSFLVSRNFFKRVIKTRAEYGFLFNPPVEGTVNSTERSRFF